jgi:hypothetical protein
MGYVSDHKGVPMTIIMENPPDGLPRETNIKRDEVTSILWKLKPTKKGELIDNICSLTRCKKEITVEDHGILLEDDQTDLVAYFHVECFRSILQKECLNSQKKMTSTDVREERGNKSKTSFRK